MQTSKIKTGIHGVSKIVAFNDNKVNKVSEVKRREDVSVAPDRLKDEIQ